MPQEINPFLKKDVANEESINLDYRRTDIENRRMEELSKFLIDIRQIDANKVNGDKTGYTIMKSWNGKAARKEDMDKINLINSKYNKELRELDFEDIEIEDNEGEGLDIIKDQVEDKTKQIDELAENIFENEKEGQIQKGEDIGRLNKIEVDSTNKITEYDTPEDYEKAKENQDKKHTLGLITRFIKNNSHIKNMDKNSKETPIEVKSEPEVLKEEVPNKTEREVSIEEFAELLKNNKIDQIIVAGSYNKNKELARFNPDLDSKGALYLLNNLNKKPIDEVYNEGAISSVIGKHGEGKESILKNVNEINPLVINKNKEAIDDKKIKDNKPVLKIFIDTGGEWLKIEENGETRILYIDHHGSGKRSATSGTKMMYEAMEKAGILENKPWVKKLVRFINDTDNLSYVDEKDKFGKRIFTETNFKSNWPRSLYALAEEYIPFNKLVELFEKGIIKDSTRPFTEDELNGEIGEIKVTAQGQEITLKKAVKEIEDKTVEVIESVKRARNFSKEKKLNLDSKNLGKIIYHNFKCKYKNKKGEIDTNIIDNKMAFKTIKAMNAETYVVWNNAKDKKSFFINSTNFDLVELANRLNEADPGCAKEVRGVFIFGKINNLTETQFLNILDPEIQKNTKRGNGKTGVEIENNNETETELKDEKQNEREKAIEELRNEIDKLTKERDEKIEAIRAKYKNS